MKNINTLIILFAVLIIFTSCKNNEPKTEQTTEYQCPMKCEGDKTYYTLGSCPVCKMDLKPLAHQIHKIEENETISDTSIFNLTSKWQTQDAQTIELKELKGKTLVMVMIYTTCKAACPRLVADMRGIEGKIPDNLKKDIHFILVSIDPETDTPTRLKAFAQENYMEGKQWTFLQGSVNSVREFANVLAVKYKQISPMDFSHSNIISVFNPKGELVHQQEGLGIDNKETIKKIIETIKHN